VFSRRNDNVCFPPIADVSGMPHRYVMDDGYHYTGNKAGAIASAFFAGGASFLIFGMLMIFFVVAPEGAPRNVYQDNRLVAAGLALCAILSCWLGLRTKRFFDRRAGRR
jgi:hypothetical protein